MRPEILIPQPQWNWEHRYDNLDITFTGSQYGGAGPQVYHEEYEDFGLLWRLKIQDKKNYSLYIYIHGEEEIIPYSQPQKMRLNISKNFQYFDNSSSQLKGKGNYQGLRFLQTIKNLIKSGFFKKVPVEIPNYGVEVEPGYKYGGSAKLDYTWLETILKQMVDYYEERMVFDYLAINDLGFRNAKI